LGSPSNFSTTLSSQPPQQQPTQNTPGNNFNQSGFSNNFGSQQQKQNDLWL